MKHFLKIACACIYGGLLLVLIYFVVVVVCGGGWYIPYIIIEEVQHSTRLPVVRVLLLFYLYEVSRGVVGYEIRFARCDYPDHFF